MKAKKQLKKLKQWLKTELQIAKHEADNGCFPHDSLKEEVKVKTYYSTLLYVTTALKNFKQNKGNKKWNK